jgi:predicted negative regulator of RcsB-dependent stress response
VLALWAPAASATGVVSPPAAEDPFFGEALYHAHQGDFFSALERLDAELSQHYGIDEPALDSLYRHLDDAEFSIGDFELRYRMHHRAGRAIRAVLASDVDAVVRAEAAYRLARLHAQKGQPEEALGVLDRMATPQDDGLREDVAFLRANVLLALDRPEDAATTLRALATRKGYAGFADFNLAIALLESGDVKAAAIHLDRAGRVKAKDRDTKAIRDKSNLVLGNLLFDAGEFVRAQSFFDRVRLSGPYSNQALLRAGWSELSAERFERAVVPWSILVERDTTDAAVQEALLALPYAYSKLEVHGRAALLYEQAAATFGSELAKLDRSIESVEREDFLRALEREEIRRDSEWVVRLRSLPEAPETHYLISLMASHPFQTALQNYLDLADMRRKLMDWQRSLSAFDEVIALRRAYHEPRLPTVDERFRKLDAQMRVRLSQREMLRERLEKLLTSPIPALLATGEERAQRDQLTRLEAALAKTRVDTVAKEALERRIRRLHGVLDWRLETTFHDRLTDVHERLVELDGHIEKLEAQYASFVRTRQATAHSYEGYSDGIAGLRARIAEASERIEELRERQGRELTRVARETLHARRDRLRAYQNKARFAFADSYDRASKQQAR